MKKLLVFFMAIGLVAASCNNDKGKNPRDDRNTDNRDRDDYRNNDRDRDDDRNDDRNNDDRNNDNRDNDYNSGGGWSSSEKGQWTKMCVDPLVESLGRTKAENYCDCVLDKIQDKYPSFDKANTVGTEEEGVELGKACMNELFK